jgi:hypothetical protein
MKRKNKKATRLVVIEQPLLFGGTIKQVYSVPVNDTMAKKDTPKITTDPRDPNEEHDDLHMMAPRAAELGGLIRRARIEVTNGNLTHALRTLGRAQDIAETFQ